MPSLPEEWLVKADADAEAARALARLDKPVHADPICFHCQQAIEKLLKALLAAASETPTPRVHDLVYLLDELRKHRDDVPELDDDVEYLDRFSRSFRYSGASAMPEEARDALGRMERVFHALVGLWATR